jgi:ribonuclease HI
MLGTKPNKEIHRHCQTVKGESSGRAELKAIISGVWVLPDDADSCTIISDSKYALDACSGRCVRFKNHDLLNIYDSIIKGRNINVTYSWVKSHNGNFYNELCDTLCLQAINEYTSNKV